jgi:hypothetical protein
MILLDIKILSKIESCQMPMRGIDMTLSLILSEKGKLSDLKSMADCHSGTVLTDDGDLELEEEFNR